MIGTLNCTIVSSLSLSWTASPCGQCHPPPPNFVSLVSAWLFRTVTSSTTHSCDRYLDGSRILIPTLKNKYKFTSNPLCLTYSLFLHHLFTIDSFRPSTIYDLLTFLSLSPCSFCNYRSYKATHLACLTASDTVPWQADQIGEKNF